MQPSEDRSQRPIASYEAWLESVPDTITSDRLWGVTVYRLGLFAADLCWHDHEKLREQHHFSLADQLYRAVGSISANVAEGYSRHTGRDRARFYEYALGSARESRDWYYKSRHALGSEVADHRMSLLTETIRLLLTMVPQQRHRLLHEPSVPYQRNSPPVDDLPKLLNTVPGH